MNQDTKTVAVAFHNWCGDYADKHSKHKTTEELFDIFWSWYNKPFNWADELMWSAEVVERCDVYGEWSPKELV